MLHMFTQDPVSPSPPAEPGGGGTASASSSLGAGAEAEGDLGEVDFKEALMDDPYVGVEVVTHDGEHPGAIAARPIRTPPEMTPAERDST